MSEVLTDCGSWWVGAAQRDRTTFAERARAEQARMHVSKGRAYATVYDATMPRVRGYHEASPRTVPALITAIER